MAKTDLARLVVSLEAQNTKLLTQLEQSEKAAQKWRSKTESAVKGVATSFKTLAIGAAIAVGMAKATRAITGAVDEMDRLSKTAQKIGVTTEALSSLEYAAKLADVSSESLQTGMVKLVRSMSDAASGTERTQKVFKALGVQYQDSTGKLRKADDVFREISQRLSEMEDGSTKTAIAVELFGRSGANLIPLLNEGESGLKAMAEEASNLGLVISTEAGKAAEAFNDNLTRLGAAVDGAANKVAAELLPDMVELSNQVVQMANDPAFVSGLATAIRGVGEAVLFTANAISNSAGLFKFLGESLAAKIGGAAVGDLVRIDDQLSKVRENLSILEQNAQRDPNTILEKQLRQQLAELEAKRELTLELERSAIQARAPIAMPAPAAAPSVDTANPFTPTGEEGKKKSTAYARALMSESDMLMKDVLQKIEDRAKSMEGVEHIKLSLLDDEGQAVAALQAKYIELQNAVAAGAITQQESAGISAKLADQWAQDQESAHQREIDSLMSGLMTQEEVINQSYERRKEAILESTYATQTEKNDMILRLEKQHTDELANLEAERMDQQLGGMAALFSGFAGLAEAAGGEQSKAYKVMFGISKAFSIAQAALSIATGLAKAQELGFPANLAEMARVAAAGAQITAAISGAQFSGAYDKGGEIPAGQYGLVGERGPELVSGPASVTSRMDTARIFDAQPADRAPVNVQVVNAIDRDDLMNDLGSSAQFERSVMNVYGRNRRRLTQASV